MKLRNTALVFIVSGFWHGANWTYIVWAFLNILYFLPFILRKKKRTRSEIVAFGKVIPSLREVLQILGTFSLNVFAYIFFRSETVGQAFSSVRTIFSESLFSLPQFEGMLHAFITFILILIFMSIEWFGRNDQFAIAKLGFTWKRHWRQLFYYSIMLAIFLFMGKQEQFVYFQF